MKQLLAKVRHLTTSIVERELWRSLRPEWVLKSGLTVQVKKNAEWVLYNDIFVDQEYDPAIDEVIRSGVPNPLVLDIGANVGYFGLRFADLWMQNRGADEPYRVIGVEGSPSVFIELKARVSRAGQNDQLLRGRLQYHLGLAGARTGQAFISTSAFHATNSIVGPRSRFGAMVSFLDVDSLLPSVGSITLLKCDIEGAEETFLQNYPDLLRRVDQLVIELHHDRCDTERCIEMIHAAGLTDHLRIRDCSASVSVDRFLRSTSK